MSTFVAMFVGLAASLPSRILMSLGMGFVSFIGFGAIYAQIQSAVIAAWGGIGGASMQILSLAGFNTALGIVLGAFAAKLSMMLLPKLARLAPQ